MSISFDKVKISIPLLSDLRNYDSTKLSSDLVAGLTVGVMLIPQGMAYSMLAGLPPVYGLYASIVPLLVYALLGTSRQLAVGPVAIIALLISSGLASFAEQGIEIYISMAILLSLMVGVIQLIMGLFKAGIMVAFLSHPVLIGFTTAAAAIIGLSQVKHLFGVEIANGKVHSVITQLIEKASEINPYTLAFGIMAIIIIVFVQRINRRLPGPLIIVLIGTLAVFLFQLDQYNLAIIGEVPGGLPSLTWTTPTLESIRILLPTALTISLIGYMESFAVAKVIRDKRKNYPSLSFFNKYPGSGHSILKINTPILFNISPGPGNLFNVVIVTS